MPPVPILYDGLLTETADKKLVFCNVFKAIATSLYQEVRVFQKALDAFVGVGATAVVNDKVEIIRIIIMFHMADHVIVSVFMQVADKFRNARVQQLHPA